LQSLQIVAMDLCRSTAKNKPVATVNDSTIVLVNSERKKKEREIRARENRCSVHWKGDDRMTHAKKEDSDGR